MKISGKFVLLKKMNLSDADFIYNLRKKKDISLYLHNPPKSLSFQKKWMMNNIKDKKTQDFMIIKKSNNRKIGTIALNKITKSNAEWGRWISKGNIIENIESVIILLNYGFNNSATISPVGIAWKRAMNQNSTINLYRNDNSHPSERGTYLTACTFYATIFKKSPIGASFKPAGMSQSTATFLQTIAHEVVLDSLGTWNIFNADFEYTIVNTASPTIYFNNLSSNYENLVWSFGDGTTSTSINPTHQYSSPGNYTVTLTIYTNSGCLIDSISQNIDIIFTNINEIHQNQEVLIESDILGRKNTNSKIILVLDERGIKTKKMQLKD